MAHSIELLLDDHSDKAIRLVWHALSDVGLPSQLRVKSATNGPHITLLAADHISPDVDDVLRELTEWLPVPCTVGSPLVFGGGKLTLARLLVPSAELLALHDEVYRRCLPHCPTEPFSHSVPGHWTPHVTLGRRFTSVQVGQALEEVDGVIRELGAEVVGLRRWDGDQRVETVLIS